MRHGTIEYKIRHKVCNNKQVHINSTFYITNEEKSKMRRYIISGCIASLS